MCSCTSDATDEHTSFVIPSCSTLLAYVIQWDSYNVDTLRNEKCVLVIGVSSFPGEVTLVELITGTFKSVHIVEVSTFQECPQDRVPLYRLFVLCCYIYKITTTRAVYNHNTSELGTPLYK